MIIQQHSKSINHEQRTCFTPIFKETELVNNFNRSLYIPMALDKLRLPFTLPSGVTNPPALSIRFFSVVSSGLWSTDKSMALPLRDRTHLESPAFATYSLLPLISARQAVQPLSLPGN